MKTYRTKIKEEIREKLKNNQPIEIEFENLKPELMNIIEDMAQEIAPVVFENIPTKVEKVLPAHSPYSESLVQEIKQSIGNLVKDITEEQRNNIRYITSQAYVNGWKMDDTANAILNTIGLTENQTRALLKYEENLTKQGAKSVSSKVERYRDRALSLRAETIARTEVMRMENNIQRHMWKEAEAEDLIPTGSVREWVVTSDDRLCPECQKMNGKRATINGNYEGGILGPPLHPNCRCVEQLIMMAPEKVEWSTILAPKVEEPMVLGNSPINLLQNKAQVPDVPGFTIPEKISQSNSYFTGDDLLISEKMVKTLTGASGARAQGTYYEKMATALEQLKQKVNTIVSAALDKWGEFIEYWAATSGDSSKTSVLIQSVANRVFNLNFSNLKFSSIDGTLWKRALDTIKAGEIGLSGDAKAIELFLKQEYLLTQDYFKRRKIKEIVVFRGLSLDEKLAREMFGGVIEKYGRAKLPLQPLSSFSFNPRTAAVFALSNPKEEMIVIATKIPVERIASTGISGLGTLYESEAVVLGGAPLDTVYVRLNGYKNLEEPIRDLIKLGGTVLKAEIKKALPVIAVDSVPYLADWLKVLDFILNPTKEFKEKEYLEKISKEFLKNTSIEYVRNLAKKYGLGGEL